MYLIMMCLANNYFCMQVCGGQSRSSKAYSPLTKLLDP